MFTQKRKYDMDYLKMNTCLVEIFMSENHKIILVV